MLISVINAGFAADECAAFYDRNIGSGFTPRTDSLQVLRGAAYELPSACR